MQMNHSSLGKRSCSPSFLEDDHTKRVAFDSALLSPPFPLPPNPFLPPPSSLSSLATTFERVVLSRSDGVEFVRARATQLCLLPSVRLFRLCGDASSTATRMVGGRVLPHETEDAVEARGGARADGVPSEAVEVVVRVTDRTPQLALKRDLLLLLCRREEERKSGRTRGEDRNTSINPSSFSDSRNSSFFSDSVSFPPSSFSDSVSFPPSSFSDSVSFPPSSFSDSVFFPPEGVNWLHVETSASSAQNEARYDVSAQTAVEQMLRRAEIVDLFDHVVFDVVGSRRGMREGCDGGGSRNSRKRNFFTEEGSSTAAEIWMCDATYVLPPHALLFSRARHMVMRLEIARPLDRPSDVAKVRRADAVVGFWTSEPPEAGVARGTIDGRAFERKLNHVYAMDDRVYVVYESVGGRQE